ncbi:sulfotransferase [Desulfogranum marinum]|uniref:sulfotransferase n=1 Tax=Desulfogranum marinum TaxID=453220 RepID=UPI0029C89A4B|nr:sulfotransferase [Desulfogranum marinum]
MEIKKYIIIGPARSGTTVTHLFLRGHPHVSALNDEVKISELFEKGISAFTFGSDLPNEKAQGPRKIYDLLALLNADSATTAAGIKCAVASVEKAKKFVEQIKSSFSDVYIILIVREDVLAQFGSILRAKKTGKFHSWIKENNRPSSSITVDKGRYSQYLLTNIEIVETLQSLKETNNFLEISYEKDILTGQDYCAKLYNFLQLDPIEPAWLNSKKVAPPPNKYISNYDSIKLAEETIKEKRQPLFTLRYFLYKLLRVIYRRTSQLFPKKYAQK